MSVTSQDTEPVVGDTVYVGGHGPARLDEIGASRGRKRYKVVYPNGDTYKVARDQIRFHEPPAQNPLSSPRLGASYERSGRERAGTGRSSPGRSESPPRTPDNTAAPSSPILSTMPVTSGPRRLEYLGRPFNDEARTMRSPSAIFGLIATMVGGGVLSLPYAMSQCGFVLGSILLVISGAASTWTMDMLVECARSTGRDTFELVGHAAFGEVSRKLTMLLVFLICWLAMVGYFVLLGDLLVPTVIVIFPSIHEHHFNPETLRKLVLCCGAVILSPMCYAKSLGAVSWLCFASVGSVILVLVVIAMRAWPVLGEEHDIVILTPKQIHQSIHFSGSYDLWPSDWVQAWYALPTFGVSYLCHFNALPTHQELTRPTSYRIRRVTFVTMGLTTALYFLFAFSGYVWSGCHTCGNILLNFKTQDTALVIGRAALSLVLMLNFPLICQPSRNALFRLLAGTPCMPVISEFRNSNSRQSSYVESRQCSVSLPPATANQVAEQPTRETALPELPEMHMRGLSGSFTVPAGPLPSSPKEKKSTTKPIEKQQMPPPPPADMPNSSWSQGSRSSEEFGARVHVYLREDTQGHRDHRSGLEAYDSFLPKDETVLKSAIEPSCWQRCALTTLVLGTALLLACVLQSVMVVWSILGSTVAFMVGYILPAAFWCKIVGPYVSPMRFRAAIALICVAVFLAISCTILTLTRLGVPPCPMITE